MESKADAVPADFFYDRITVCLCVGVDRIRDISQVSPWLCGSQTKFNTLFCYADQPFGAVRDFSHFKHARRIGKIAVQVSGNIHINNIPFLDNNIFVRNAVADFVVKRSAYTFREALIIQRRGNAAVFCGETIYNFINFRRAHPDTDMLCNFVQYCSVKYGTFSDLFNLRRGFQQRF